MSRRPAGFYSNGLRLDGELYLPDDLEPGERRPAIVTCSGYQGLKAIHPARFARALAPHGFVCLAFDYRGFGHSDGERGRLVPQDQCEDVRAAVSFLQTVPEVDPDAISLIGWALGGRRRPARATASPARARRGEWAPLARGGTRPLRARRRAQAARAPRGQRPHGVGLRRPPDLQAGRRAGSRFHRGGLTATNGYAASAASTALETEARVGFTTLPFVPDLPTNSVGVWLTWSALRSAS